MTTSGCQPRRDELGQHLGAVADEPDRDRARARPCASSAHRSASSRSAVSPIEVAGLDPALDPRGVDLDAERDAVVHRDGERLRAAHAAEPARERDRAGERPAEVLVRALGERLVRALQDPLGADVDPRARGHLAVHREPLRLELAEGVPVGPLRHEHRVRDQHARGHVVRAEDRDGLARLHEQGLVVGQRPQRAHDRVERLPDCGRPGRCRRRRRGPPAARRPRGRGCSSACASPLPAARNGTTARRHVAHGSLDRSSRPLHGAAAVFPARCYSRRHAPRRVPTLTSVTEMLEWPVQAG